MMKAGLIRGSLVTLLALALVIVAGCNPYPDSSRDQTLPPTSNRSNIYDFNKISVDDQVIVMFSGTPEPPTNFQDRVKDDGTINLPLIGNIRADGLTPKELQDQVHAAYVPDYFKRLSVVVRLEERYFFVGGEVRRPDRFPYVGEMTVLQAINTANGFTDFADKRDVVITRSSTGRQIKVDCIEAQRNPSKDVPVYPDDNINVPRRLF